MRKANQKTSVIAEDQDSRANLFLMHEAFITPGERKSPAAPTVTDVTFVADFHKQYSRLPAVYKRHPIDQGVEIIKIGMIAKLCDELRSLTQELKAKLST
jgi:hypothetical protein